MVAKVAADVSKGRRRQVKLLLCLFAVETLVLVILAQCGDGDAIMAMRDIVAFVAP